MKGANGIEAMSDQFKIIDYWNRKSMLCFINTCHQFFFTCSVEGDNSLYHKTDNGLSASTKDFCADQKTISSQRPGPVAQSPIKLILD